MDYAYLGRQIRHYRRVQHVSQSALAQAIGVSAAHIGHIERGSRRASLDTVVAISQELKVSLDQLIFPAIPDVQEGPVQRLSRLLEEAQAIIGRLTAAEHADGQ